MNIAHLDIPTPWAVGGPHQVTQRLNYEECIISFYPDRVSHDQTRSHAAQIDIASGQSNRTASRNSNDTLQFVAAPGDSAQHYLTPALQAHKF